MTEDTITSLREKTAADWRAYVDLLDQSIASIGETLERLRDESHRLHRAAAAATLTDVPFEPSQSVRPATIASPPSVMDDGDDHVREHAEAEAIVIESSVASEVADEVKPSAGLPDQAVAAEATSKSDEADELAAKRAELERIVAAARDLPNADITESTEPHHLAGFEGLSEGGGLFEASRPAPKAPPRRLQEAHVSTEEPIAPETIGGEEVAKLADAEVEPLDAVQTADVESDDDARREELRRAVEAAKTQVTGERPGLAELMKANPIAEAIESSLGFELEAGPEPLDEEAGREELMPTVEAARIERSAPEMPEEEVGEESRSPLDFAAVKASAREPNITMPIVVIDDPEGRVELVKVYRTLARLGCGTDANLINYTPHGVTISLDPAVMPPDEDWGQAVEAVFDRTCELMRDSSHLRVRIASNAKAV